MDLQVHRHLQHRRRQLCTVSAFWRHQDFRRQHGQRHHQEECLRAPSACQIREGHSHQVVAVWDSASLRRPGVLRRDAHGPTSDRRTHGQPLRPTSRGQRDYRPPDRNQRKCPVSTPIDRGVGQPHGVAHGPTHSGSRLVRVASRGHFERSLREVTSRGRFERSLREVASRGRFERSLREVASRGHFKRSLQEVTS